MQLNVFFHRLQCGVYTLGDGGRCSIKKLDLAIVEGVDTLRNEGRCSTDFLPSEVNNVVDTLKNMGRCSANARVKCEKWVYVLLGTRVDAVCHAVGYLKKIWI